MPSNRQLIPIILKNITPVLENLIERIAEDHDLDSKILKRKYLNELKTYNKKVSRRKGIINAYAAFLGDKSVEEALDDLDEFYFSDEIEESKKQLPN